MFPRNTGDVGQKTKKMSNISVLSPKPNNLFPQQEEQKRPLKKVAGLRQLWENRVQDIAVLEQENRGVVNQKEIVLNSKQNKKEEGLVGIREEVKKEKPFQQTNKQIVSQKPSIALKPKIVQQFQAVAKEQAPVSNIGVIEPNVPPATDNVHESTHKGIIGQKPYIALKPKITQPFDPIPVQQIPTQNRGLEEAVVRPKVGAVHQSIWNKEGVEKQKPILVTKRVTRYPEVVTTRIESVSKIVHKEIVNAIKTAISASENNKILNKNSLDVAMTVLSNTEGLQYIQKIFNLDAVNCVKEASYNTLTVTHGGTPSTLVLSPHDKKILYWSLPNNVMVENVEEDGSCKIFEKKKHGPNFVAITQDKRVNAPVDIQRNKYLAKLQQAVLEAQEEGILGSELLSIPQIVTAKGKTILTHSICGSEDIVNHINERYLTPREIPTSKIKEYVRDMHIAAKTLAQKGYYWFDVKPENGVIIPGTERVATIDIDSVIDGGKTWTEAHLKVSMSSVFDLIQTTNNKLKKELFHRLCLNLLAIYNLDACVIVKDSETESVLQLLSLGARNKLYQDSRNTFICTLSSFIA